MHVFEVFLGIFVKLMWGFRIFSPRMIQMGGQVVSCHDVVLVFMTIVV